MSILWTVTKGEMPLRQLLPKRDVVLSDGRCLKLERQTPSYGILGPWGHYSGPEGLSVIASVDPTRYGPLLHVTVSHPGKMPPEWWDLTLIRDAFYGPVADVMMMLPHHEEFLDAHNFCVHLWQAPVNWGNQ